ncbi:MAG: sigma-70 family RNA polymerase sigma factor [Bacteroidales bacterium]|nr:sigma-70 family RNA polymerase sigma factor [Bacteroidales bacterium]
MTTPHNHTSLSDPELVNLYREKLDPELLGVLYKRYMLLVYGVCMKYLKNRDDSQDAVMQIFETLVTDVPRFEIRNFKSWLYGVTRNHCLMKLRKDHAEKNRHDQISAELFVESTSVLHPIDDNEDSGLQERLKSCMEQLKEEQRRCVEMFYYHQRCYKEIAAELALDENKVKSAIQNGKRNLKICIESKPLVKNVQD